MTDPRSAGELRRALRTERFALTSPRGVDEVIRRAILLHEGQIRVKRARHEAFLIGVHGNRLVISRRDHANNSFRPRLIAEIGDDEGGSIIECEVRPLRFVVAFMAVWMVMAAAAAVVGVSALLDGVVLGVVGLAFPVAGFGLMWFGARLAHHDRALLRLAIEQVAGAGRA